MALNDWEQKVQPAVLALGELERLVMEDLDEDRGGVGWWVDMLDWKRRVLLADYLLQSIDGAAPSATARASTSRCRPPARRCWPGPIRRA